MKPMGLDLKSFKKVRDEEKTATLRHPKGHEITIAKKALSRPLRSQLEELPLHLDEGGAVKDPTEGIADEANASNVASGHPVTININNGQGQPQTSQAPQPSAPPTPAPVLSPSEAAAKNWEATKNTLFPDREQRINPNDVDYRAYLAKQAQAQDQAQPAPLPQSAAPMPAAPAGPQDPYGTEAYSDAVMKGINEQRAALQGIGNAQAAEGASQASALRGEIPLQRQQMENFQKEYQGLNSERQAMISDLQNQHIDPNHYINSLSTGKKVLAGIGLILGGMGGQGHGNAGLDVLQRNIQNDIDSQKAELGKKENLLSNNLRQFGNMRDASDFLRVQHNDIISNKLKAMALQSGSGLAKLQAQLAIGKLDQDSAGIMQMIAARRAMLSGGQGQIDPSTHISMLLPQNEQAKAHEDLDKVQGYNSRGQNILNLFEQADKENTLLKTGAGKLRTPPSVLALNTEFDALAKDREGRVNEQVLHDLKATSPQPGDLSGTVAEKRKNLLRMLQEGGTSSLLDAYRVPYKKFQPASRFAPGSVVEYQGKRYRLGSDGNTLTPLQ